MSTVYTATVSPARDPYPTNQSARTFKCYSREYSTAGRVVIVLGIGKVHWSGTVRLFSHGKSVYVSGYLSLSRSPAFYAGSGYPGGIDNRLFRSSDTVGGLSESSPFLYI